MDFFNSAIDTLQTLVVALGGALCVWGGINLLEGYGNDNPGAKSQGVKQLVAGGGVRTYRNYINSSAFRTLRINENKPVWCVSLCVGMHRKGGDKQ